MTARSQCRRQRSGSPVLDSVSEHGSALLMSMMVLLLVGLMATGLAQTAINELDLSANVRGATRAFYAADGGAEKAFHDLLQVARATGGFPLPSTLTTIQPPVVGSTTFPGYGVNENGAMIIEPLPSGFYQGLTALT